MRFLMINYFGESKISRFLTFKTTFLKKYKQKFLNLDTDFKLIEIQQFEELNKYTYRNKQNFSSFMLQTLNHFKIIDVVIIGKPGFIFYHLRFREKRMQKYPIPLAMLLTSSGRPENLPVEPEEPENPGNGENVQGKQQAPFDFGVGDLFSNLLVLGRVQIVGYFRYQTRFAEKHVQNDIRRVQPNLRGLFPGNLKCVCQQNNRSTKKKQPEKQLQIHEQGPHRPGEWRPLLLQLLRKEVGGGVQRRIPRPAPTRQNERAGNRVRKQLQVVPQNDKFRELGG